MSATRKWLVAGAVAVLALCAWQAIVLLPQIEPVVKANIPLSVALVCLIGLAGTALACVVMGFRAEGRLGKSGKLHDLIE